MQVNTLIQGADTISLQINGSSRVFQIKDLPEITTESVWRDAIAGVEAESKDPDKIELPSLSFSPLQNRRGIGFKEQIRLTGFKERIRLLAVDAQALADAKKHNTRNKVLACLLCALNIAIIIGAVFGVMALSAASVAMPGLGAVAVFVCLGVAIAHLLIPLRAATRLNLVPSDERIKGVMLCGLIGMGVPLPIYEAFTRVSRLQVAHDKNLADVSAHVAELVNFFDREGTALKNRVTRCLTQCRNAATSVTAGIAINSILKDTVTRHEQALRELDAVIEFYKTPRVSVT
jgi:hypothetical protein